MMPESDKLIAPPTPSNKATMDALKDCAKHGSIGVDDSVIFNEATMRNEEEKFANIFVGDPVNRNGKFYFTVKAFDM